MSVKSFHVPATPGTFGLAAEPAFGADFARDARHLAGEAVELVDHRVDRLLELQDLAAHVDGDLARQVAAGDGGRDLGDVAHLAGEVAGHRVDAVGQVLPGAGDAGHLRLAAELALRCRPRARRASLRAAKALSWSTIVLMVSLSSRISPRTSTVILLREIAARDRGRHLGDVAHLAGKV